jgi:hypothetical protein
MDVFGQIIQIAPAERGHRLGNEFILDQTDVGSILKTPVLG